jgi:glycosyltransferase involved in cell wall biosynthesis
MKALIVIPTYNERNNIEPLIEKILSQPLDAEILIVDDHSPDGTGKEADRLAAAQPKLHVLHRSGKLGLGTAYLAGMRYFLDRTYDCCVTMDADFSHDPAYLPELIEGMSAYDIMIGSRYVPGGGTANWGLFRRMLSRTANFTAHIVLGLPANDCTAGFRCYHRRVLEAIALDRIKSNGYSFLEEMLYICYKKGFTCGEIPIVFKGRIRDKSKITKIEIFKALVTIVRMRLRRRI